MMYLTLQFGPVKMKIIILDHDSLNDVPYITVWPCGK